MAAILGSNEAGGLDFAALSEAFDDNIGEEQLCLQEALMYSLCLNDTNSSSDSHYRSSEIGESSSSSLKIKDNYKNTKIIFRSKKDKKMKSSVDVNTSASDDDQQTSETASSCEISKNSKKDKKKVCQICMEAKPKREMRKSTRIACHVYCSECITKYIAEKMEENITQIKCPRSYCKEMLELNLCRDILPGQVFDRWENALCESSIPDSQKFYCPFKDCSAMLVNDDDEWNVIRNTMCPHCCRLFCAKCKVSWHSDMDCDQYKNLQKRGGKEDEFQVKLAEDNKWKDVEVASILWKRKKDFCI